jgi:hypothetical protein
MSPPPAPTVVGVGTCDGEIALAGGLGGCGVTGICPHPLCSAAVAMIAAAAARPMPTTVVLCHKHQPVPGTTSRWGWSAQTTHAELHPE